MSASLAAPILALPKSAHAAFFAAHLKTQPSAYLSLWTNRVALLHFVVVALDLLGSLDVHLPPGSEVRASVVDWVYSLQPSTGPWGGFRGSPALSSLSPDPAMDPPELAATYSALCVLTTLGDSLARVRRGPLLSLLRACIRTQPLSPASSTAPSAPGGSGSGAVVGVWSSPRRVETDARFLYCLCAAATLADRAAVAHASASPDAATAESSPPGATAAAAALVWPGLPALGLARAALRLQTHEGGLSMLPTRDPYTSKGEELHGKRRRWYGGAFAADNDSDDDDNDDDDDNSYKSYVVPGSESSEVAPLDLFPDAPLDVGADGLLLEAHGGATYTGLAALTLALSAAAAATAAPAPAHAPAAAALVRVRARAAAAGARALHWCLQRQGDGRCWDPVSNSYIDPRRAGEDAPNVGNGKDEENEQEEDEEEGPPKHTSGDGFSGRTGKGPDSCYAFWVGAAARIAAGAPTVTAGASVPTVTAVVPTVTAGVPTVTVALPPLPSAEQDGAGSLSSSSSSSSSSLSLSATAAAADPEAPDTLPIGGPSSCKYPSKYPSKYPCEPRSPLSLAAPVRAWLVSECEGCRGGFARDDAHEAEAYHGFLSLAGLALLQEQDGRAPDGDTVSWAGSVGRPGARTVGGGGTVGGPETGAEAEAGARAEAVAGQKGLWELEPFEPVLGLTRRALGLGLPVCAASSATTTTTAAAGTATAAAAAAAAAGEGSTGDLFPPLVPGMHI